MIIRSPENSIGKYVGPYISIRKAPPRSETSVFYKALPVRVRMQNLRLSGSGFRV